MKYKIIIILLSLILMLSNIKMENVFSAEIKSISISKTKLHQDNIVGLNNKNALDYIRKKEDYFKTGLKFEKDLAKLPKDFLNFANLFITDSIFQKQHIDFNYLIGVIGKCDSIIVIDSSNIRYSNWNFIKEFSEGNLTNKWENKVFFLDNRVYLEFNLKEIGKIYKLGFEKINEMWINTLYVIDEC